MSRGRISAQLWSNTPGCTPKHQSIRRSLLNLLFVSQGTEGIRDGGVPDFMSGFLKNLSFKTRKKMVYTVIVEHH